MASGMASGDRDNFDQTDQKQVQAARQLEQPSQLAPSHPHSSVAHDASGDAFHMSSMTRALPPETPDAYTQQLRYSHVNSPTTMRQVSPYAVQPQVQQYQGYAQGPGHAASAVQYQPYIDQSGMGMPPYSPVQGPYPGPSMYASAQNSPQYSSFPAGYVAQTPIQRGYQGQPHPYPGPEYPHMGSTTLQQNVSSPTGHAYNPQQGTRQTYPSSSPPVQSAPRGPPRKPKQSGHALWVGNLPPGTQVGDLKDHFSLDATEDIESVFLISKSNCAFVNYKSESACSAAMTRFHDSRFQGVRLVCRLRRGPGSVSSPSTPTTAAPSGPAALQSGTTQSQSAVDAITQNRESSAKATEAASAGEQPVNDKYFIVKSLTVEDLELSARNGIWATQEHNEDALNKAYEAVGNVFLIFSANKSGEYYGYARMESPINDETAKDLEWKPYEGTRSIEVSADPELPKSIPTPATDHAPKGRIIDDSARGTIFWEADTDETDEEAIESAEKANPTGSADRKAEDYGASEEERGRLGKESSDTGGAGAGEASHQTFGRPFKVAWMSTNKLPFYRTRGLRNPWNANREVKIARDGTELETSVGRRLVATFHRTAGPQQIQATQMQSQQQPFVGHMPPQMGYGMGPMPPGRY